MLTSHDNTKSRKDLLLTKIRQAKKETSAMNKEETSVIMGIAKQIQKYLIEDNNVSELKLISTLHMQTNIIAMLYKL